MFIKCPYCSNNTRAEQCRNDFSLSVDNVQYPKHFYSFKNGVRIENDKVQEWIDEVLKNLEECNEDHGVYGCVGSGNTKVIGFKFSDAYTVVVAKEYEETTIFRDCE